MEVKEPSAKYLAQPGYKQTEVGAIPADWEVSQLKELLTIKSGQAFSSIYFSDKGPILLTPGNFKLDGGLYFNERNTKRYSGPYTPAMVFDYNDLLVVMTDLTPDCNLLGKPAFVRMRDVILHNQRIGKITPISGRISLSFLYWYFLSDAHARRMKETATGSTVRHTSNSSIYVSSIALPPTKTEQDAIAEALSDADALIESLGQLLTKKRHLKQGAMQELLTGKKRLPGSDGKLRQVLLGDVADVIKGSGISKAKISISGARSCVLYGELFTTYGRVITNVISRTDTSEGLNSMAGDILMPGSTTTTGIDLAIASALLMNDVALGGDINVIRKKSDCYDASFLANYLTHVKRKAIAELTQGITIHHLYGRELRRISMQLPSVREQSAIAAVLSDMDAEIAELEAKLAKARQIKQGMMQELLTGRIRLV